MDGVLIDSEPLWRRAEIEVFAGLGLALSEEDCLETQGLRIDEVVDFWLERRPWPSRSREPVAHAIVSRVAALIRREARPLPGAEETLAAACTRGWRLALASSSPRRLIETVIDRFGWRAVFECIHSAEEEARGKPDPAVYLSTAAALGLPASACVAIEDSLAGLASARAAGMRCLVVPPPETAHDPGFGSAWRRLDSLAELPDALAGLEDLDDEFDDGEEEVRP